MLRLNPKVRKFIYEQSNNNGFDPNTPIVEYREAIKEYIDKSNRDYACFNTNVVDQLPVLTNQIKINTKIFTTPVHLYKPAILKSAKKLLPCIVYFTGSGFVYSNPTWQARNCLDLATQTGCMILNIEERTAPEYKFPAGLQESFAVIEWLFKHGNSIGIDTNDIRLCGFSSGGNFAAVLARWCMEKSLPIRAQYLISPWLDLTCSTKSYIEFSKGFLLDLPVCHWLRSQYTEYFQFTNPDVSPLFFRGSLSKIAPCTIIVAECEPFFEEGLIYATSLRQQGVSVRFSNIRGQIHEYAGCNRWRLTSQFDDPIVQAALAVKADNATIFGRTSNQNPNVMFPSKL
jgi:acetyl esterase